jgi:hypothetical protein
MEKTLPFIEFINSDFSKYPKACDTINPKTGLAYIDADEDFLIGDSGGFLMKWDFKFINTHLFTEVADTYTKNVKNPSIIAWVEGLDIPRNQNRGKHYYCPHLKGTYEYNDFWSRETFRRRNGMTAKCKQLRDGKVVDLHITGDMYNYLNYGRILRTPNEEELKVLHSKGDFKTKLISAFPRFWDGDYWNFKIDFFISSNSFHLTKAKARGKGYSYKRGSQAANTVNLVANATIIMAAYDIAYLTDPGATADMLKTNLDWYEEHTDWKRFYLSESLDSIELGYKTKKGGNKKYGYRSKALAVTLFNNPSAAIGKRALEVDFEESGKCPNIEQALDVTLSSTEVGASNVGTIRAYGTAGVKGADWRGFSNIYYNPSIYKMMPFENVWDDNARRTVCGFFHPQVLNMEPFMDKDGNSLFEQAYAYDLEDKSNYAKTESVDKWLMYVGQRANKPSEAFKTASENIFSSPGLSKHIVQLQSGVTPSYYRDGMLFEVDKKIVFKTNNQLIDEGNAKYAHPFIMEVPYDVKKDFYGCIREFHPPFKKDGKVPDNLYSIVFDSVGKDKKSELVIGKNSLNSVNVYMHFNNISNTTGDILVASYAGRPDEMSTVNKMVYYLCQYYNAKVLPEVDRGTIVADFKTWNALRWIYTDPTETLNNKQNDSKTPNYGIVIGEKDNATEALIYLREWLYTKRSESSEDGVTYNYHYVCDIPLLLELENFTISGNFDRISSMRLIPFLIKQRQVLKKDDILNAVKQESILASIGLYDYNTNI